MHREYRSNLGLLSGWAVHTTLSKQCILQLVSNGGLSLHRTEQISDLNNRNKLLPFETL